MVNIILSKLLSSTEINWVCLACTAGAPVCFQDVPTSYECDYIVKGEYMSKGGRNVRCFSQFKNNYDKVQAELGFFQASCCLDGKSFF